MTTHNTDPGRLLAVTDAAQFAGVPDSMIRRLIRLREVPTVKVGRYVRIRLSDLEAYLEANTRPAR